MSLSLYPLLNYLSSPGLSSNKGSGLITRCLVQKARNTLHHHKGIIVLGIVSQIRCQENGETVSVANDGPPTYYRINRSENQIHQLMFRQHTTFKRRYCRKQRVLFICQVGVHT